MILFCYQFHLCEQPWSVIVLINVAYDVNFYSYIMTVYCQFSLSQQCKTTSRHPDGTCEVLEVKCHSPFMEIRQYDNYRTNPTNGSNSGRGNSSSNNGSSGGRGYRGGDRSSAAGALTISDRGPADTVATWHIPQLQLHILCAGTYVTLSIAFLILYFSHLLLTFHNNE